MASMSARGALFSLLVLLLFLLLPKKIKSNATALLGYRHDYISTTLLGIFFITGLVYLAYPNYLDHVESTIAYLGIVLERGGEIYPFPNPYPYHGLLYGPGLATIQTVFSHMGLPVLIRSKIPGLAAFLASIIICFYLIKGQLAKGYLLYLPPFGLMLFWDRAEPFFLLLVCVTLFITDKKTDRKYLPILIGILAGTASALKLHGVVYILSAYLAATLGMTLSIFAVLAFTISAAISFLIFFLPSNISLIYFIEYLKLASIHSLSLRIWFEEILYLSFLAIPVLITWSGSRKKGNAGIKILAIFSIEFIVTIVGAKPGAGVHHLLPFIPVNAYIIHKLYLDIDAPSSPVIKAIYLSLIIPALSTVWATFTPMIKKWENFKKAGDEIQLFNKKYPDLVMGITDNRNYSYAFLRVLLTGDQIDYTGYMDLQFSGVSDFTLTKKMSECEIKNILLPNRGTPFSMTNWYTGSPLLSQGVQQSFLSFYTKSFQGNYFSVYKCSK